MTTLADAREFLVELITSRLIAGQDGPTQVPASTP
jgi:hypothetical protein